jgi:putative PIN family toxin of toxin-antitoxin system
VKTPRVVFDVTVLVDALLRPEAASADLLRRLVTERDFELVVSPAILRELEAALHAPELEPFLAGSGDQLRRYVASLGVVGTTVAGDSGAAGSAHAAPDAIYLAAARESGALLIVSLDADELLGAEPGTAVVEPEMLLELLDARRLGASGE